MKKMTTIIISVGVIGLLGFTFLPGFIDNIQSRSAAKGLLDNVINQDYGDAFESVYFFDKASDLKPTIPHEDAKKKWVERVTDLREQGVYLVDYNHLRVRLDDSYPKGTVDLVFMENGKKEIKEDVSLWFGSRDGTWKLGDFHYHKNDEDWEEALSGRFKEEN